MNIFYTLRHIQYGIDITFQCLKCIAYRLDIEPFLSTVFKIIITLCHQIL